MVDFILKAIDKVLSQINKSGSEEEKQIANGLVNQFKEKGLIPTKYVKPFFYENKKKGEVVYVDSKNNRFVANLQKKDKFDKYIGASLAYGNYSFGSKTKYHKAISKFFGVDLSKENVEKYSVLYQYHVWGGKEKFETYVNENIKG